jgi:hypothetical protein
MQDLIQDQSPEIPFYYMENIGAYRIDKYTGYITMTLGILSYINIWSILSVHLITAPAVTATTASTSTTAAAPDNTPWIVAAIAIIIAIGAIGVAMRGRRKEPKD